MAFRNYKSKGFDFQSFVTIFFPCCLRTEKWYVSWFLFAHLDLNLKRLYVFTPLCIIWILIFLKIYDQTTPGC